MDLSSACFDKNHDHISSHMLKITKGGREVVDYQIFNLLFIKFPAHEARTEGCSRILIK